MNLTFNSRKFTVHTHQNLGWVKYKLHTYAYVKNKYIQYFHLNFVALNLKEQTGRKPKKISYPRPPFHSFHQNFEIGNKKFTCTYYSSFMNVNQFDLPFKLSAKLTSASVTGPTSWWTTRSSQSCESNVENISSRASMEPHTSA